MADFAVPSLPMRDVQETRVFYKRLGFVCAHEQPPPDSFLYMVRNGVYVQFYIASGVDVRLIDHVFSVYVDDLDATYAAFKAAGPDTLMPIEHKPWGFPEFALVDPNGNLMRVASPKFEIR